jgi:23S rRNA pseudouridine2605 synthase
MRDRPHPNHKLEWPGGVVPEWARPQQNGKQRFGRRGGKGAKGAGGAAAGKRERLQKVMAQSGHGSRRNIEILIAQGHLTINGQVAKLGDSVGPGDKVKLDGHLINLRFGEQLPRVLLYHKPAGEIVTRDDPENRATVFEKLPKVNGGRWVSVGRLDFNTEGLLIFTTSGELAQRLTHPRFEVEREYAVRVMGELTDEQRERLLKTGVDIDGETCTFDGIEDRGGEGANHWYHVVLREGRNREVRRMFEAVGLMVSRLIRVRFGSVALPGHVKRGMLREMEEEQVQELLAFAGMNEPSLDEEADAGEDDELENFGNRIQDHREAKAREIDDDIGNKINPRAHVAQPEPDGNRGTYDTTAERPAPGERVPGKGRRPHGKPFGFKKGRGAHQGQGGDSDNRGNMAPPPPRQGHGQGQGQGGQGQPGQGQPHHNKRRKKHRGGGPGQPGNVAPQGAMPGQPAAGPAPQGGQPGAGKPGRNRRHKNRNRNRGGGGGNEARGNEARGNEGRGNEARGEQQPPGNDNREPG